MSRVRSLSEQWLHLGLGATAKPLEPFDGMEWYARYEADHAADGVEGRLVSQFTFDANWDMWEMHPSGAEVVICTAGAITLLQEGEDGDVARITLAPGNYAVNQPGTWHTADVPGSATCIFITAGAGTQHRPREG